MFQTKDKSPEMGLNKREFRNLPDRAFRITDTNMITKVRRATHEQSEDFRKEIKNIRNYHTEIRAEEHNN